MMRQICNVSLIPFAIPSSNTLSDFKISFALLFQWAAREIRLKHMFITTEEIPGSYALAECGETECYCHRSV